MTQTTRLLPPSIATLIALVIILLTCAPRDELFNNPRDAVRCYAFTCDTVITTEPKIGDTIHFSTRDTIHTQDSVTLVGVIYPRSDKIKSSTWTISNELSTDNTILRKKFSKGGEYTAIFTIEDNAGLTMSDSVVVWVNTAPLKPVLVKQDRVDPTTKIELEWTCSDPDGDSLQYKGDLYLL